MSVSIQQHKEMYMMIEKYFSDPILTSKFSCVIINLNCSFFTFHLVFLLLTLSFHLRCYLCIPVNVFYKGIFRSAKAIDPIFYNFLDYLVAKATYHSTRDLALFHFTLDICYELFTISEFIRQIIPLVTPNTFTGSLSIGL